MISLPPALQTRALNTRGPTLALQPLAAPVVLMRDVSPHDSDLAVQQCLSLYTVHRCQESAARAAAAL